MLRALKTFKIMNNCITTVPELGESVLYACQCCFVLLLISNLHHNFDIVCEMDLRVLDVSQ